VIKQRNLLITFSYFSPKVIHFLAALNLAVLNHLIHLAFLFYLSARVYSVCHGNLHSHSARIHATNYQQDERQNSK